jgi:hypothetical protein
MSTYDLYGAASEDLRVVKTLLERSLGVIFEERDGDYQGGIYYIFGDTAAEHLVLKRNLDPFDGDATESDFPDSKILLYVNDTHRSADLEGAIRQIGSLTLLRREE